VGQLRVAEEFIKEGVEGFSRKLSRGHLGAGAKSPGGTSGPGRGGPESRPEVKGLAVIASVKKIGLPVKASLRWLTVSPPWETSVGWGEAPAGGTNTNLAKLAGAREEGGVEGDSRGTQRHGGIP